ncbi:hypothetical protein [Myroides sp. N17-2]|uniref:hypothetical protein n=1 Tax=Myroides sp. N17-2 TaxID=2030799 RepID=UPI000EFB14DE|nr:hypothetical protein [Myroides sp. N17-2]
MRYFICLILLVVLFFSNCSRNSDFDSIIEQKVELCVNKTNDCILDFSELICPEWDTMYYFSVGVSLDEIEQIIGGSYTEWEDIGDRVVFLNNGKIVYQKYWFPTIDQAIKGVVFVTDVKTFKVSKTDAKFKATKQDGVIYLKKL